MANKVELLAPAGNMECLKAAVNTGADAVYLAGNKFGARAYADNFEQEELCEAIDYCHLFDVKVYLTLNTLVKEREFDEIYEYVLPFYERGLDGVIIQDFGVLKFLHDMFPHMELHASTQMTVTGTAGTKLLQEYGVKRIVPARELSLKELTQIKKETGIDMEIFIHGAMCYGYSGQCLFSSVLGGRSGNRGRCAGPCRLPYDVYDGEQKLTRGSLQTYPLSLKDLCTIELLAEFIAAGMDSFKIEGRMKSAVYVAGVTAIYRKYIDLYEVLASKYGDTQRAIKEYQVAKEDLELLRQLYVRTDLETGYFHRHNGKQLVTLSKPCYETGSDAVAERISQQYILNPRKKKIQMFASFFASQPAILTLTVGDISVCVSGEPVSKAQNRPMSQDDLKKQLMKLGNTSFVCQDIEIEMDEQIFIANKAINELRRQAVSELQKELLKGYVRKVDASLRNRMAIAHDTDKRSDYTEQITVSVRSREQLMACIQNPVMTRLFLDMDLCLKHQNNSDFLNKIQILKENKIALYMLFPRVMRIPTAELAKEALSFAKEQGFSGAVTGSLEGLALAKQAGMKVLADAGLYSFNQYAVRWLKEMGCREVTLPLECNYHEQLEIKSDRIPSMLCVYGHIPLMESAGCIAKTLDDCRRDGRCLNLKDRKGIAFPVVLHCNRCENTIYNCIPMLLPKLITDEAGQMRIRMDFTIENQTETEEMLSFMKQRMEGLSPDIPPKEYTKGYYKRGVE